MSGRAFALLPERARAVGTTTGGAQLILTDRELVAVRSPADQGIGRRFGSTRRCSPALPAGCTFGG